MKGEKKTVLIVDDMENWRDLLTNILKNKFDVFACGSLKEAKNLIIKRDPPFHVAILDIRLADNDPLNQEGLELADFLNKRGGHTKSIVLTGYPTFENIKKSFKDLNVFDYIYKNPESENGDGFEYNKFLEEVNKAANEAAKLRSRNFEHVITKKEKSKFRIFLSYVKSERDKVRLVYDQLENEGFTPWMDMMDIKGGEKWEDVIEQSIKDSIFFLVFISKKSLTRRGFFQKEINYALEIAKKKLKGDIYLIPIRLENCDVPDNLNKFQWIDIFEKDGFERLKHSLYSGIERYLGGNFAENKDKSLLDTNSMNLGSNDNQKEHESFIFQKEPKKGSDNPFKYFYTLYRPSENYTEIDQVELCDLLDKHSTKQDLSKVQKKLKNKFPNTTEFFSLDNIPGNSKYQKIESIIEILMTYGKVYEVCKIFMEIRKDDEILHKELKNFISDN
jgi:ActR/RegA family two-component response regulator